MHPTAFIACQLFFTMLNDIYVEDGFCLSPPASLKILDVGSYDVNGNLRSAIHQSRFNGRNYEYLGIDIAEGPNVDLVYNNTQWPFQQYSLDVSPKHISSSQLFDIIISSSCFEHDDFFCETFLNIVDSLNPGGFIFINVPSSGMVHRFPVDNWRLYSDSAYALTKWANRHGHHLHVIHTSTITCSTSPYNENCDTNMIFWKSYHPPTPSPTGIDDSSQQGYCSDVPNVHYALQDEEQLQKFFKLFRANVISRLKSYVMHTTQELNDLIPMPDEDEQYLSELVDPEARPYRTLFP